jgi:hypothetical protein
MGIAVSNSNNRHGDRRHFADASVPFSFRATESKTGTDRVDLDFTVGLTGIVCQLFELRRVHIGPEQIQARPAVDAFGVIDGRRVSVSASANAGL